jgi:NAD-dependent deacetylase
MKTQDTGALIEKAAEMIVGAHSLLVFTGAGISTESGIPDFRSPGGIWDRFDPDDFYIDRFLESERCRRLQWQIFGEGLLSNKAEPNLAHIAIAELHRMGRLDCVVTQNIDNLHQKAGVPDNKVFELHGNMRWAACLSCHRRYPFEEIVVRLEAGEEIPACTACGGMLKPDIVMFGEQLPADILQEAGQRASEADVCLVIGSTLVVYPAAYIPLYAVRAGARLILINLSKTPMDRQADILINAKAGEAMTAILEALKRYAGTD